MSHGSKSSTQKPTPAPKQSGHRTGQDVTLLSVIIVNYNVKEFLEQTLISVKKSLSGIESEIIVVDNNSTDGSVRLLKERFPEVKLIENDTNEGFAKASNQGLRAARGEYLALLNPDTIVKEDTFAKMVEFYSQHPNTGMLGCKILNPDGTLQLACRRSFPTPWIAFTKLSGLSHLFPKSRLMGKYNLTYLDENETCEVEAISGSFMMVRRQVLESVGYLDDSFFLYGEDLDWCYRIHQEGWKVHYFPGTQIVHFKGESSKHAQFDQLKVFYRAMSLFVHKHFKSKYLFMPYRVLLLAIWARAGFSFVVKCLNRFAAPFVDLFLLSLSVALGVYFRFGTLQELGSFVPIIGVYTVVSMVFLNHFGSYGRYKFSVAKSVFAVFGGFLVIAGLLFFFKQFAYSRFVILLAGAMSLVTVPGWRLLLLMLHRSGSGPLKSIVGESVSRNTLIVGDIESGSRLIKKLDSQVDHGYKVAGLVSINGVKTDEISEGIEVCGTIDELGEIIERHHIQEVIFSTDRISYDRILSLITRLGGHGVSFKLVPGNLEVVIGKASIDRIDGVPLLDLDYKLYRPHYRVIKRTFDFVLAAILLILTLPIFTVKRISGAKLVRKRVLGLNGKDFQVAQFQDASSRFIRNIPHLWMVLKGPLSLVGRELVFAEKKERRAGSGHVPLKPGMTGLAQVNRSKNLSDDDRERYHLFYVKNYSLLLDLEIILRAVFSRSGDNE